MRWFWLIFIVVFVGVGAVVFLAGPGGAEGAGDGRTVGQSVSAARQVGAEGNAGPKLKEQAVPGSGPVAAAPEAEVGGPAASGAAVAKPAAVSADADAQPGKGVEAKVEAGKVVVDAKPVDAKPIEANQDDAKVVDAAAKDAKLADAKHADGKPKDDKPAASAADQLKELFPETSGLLPGAMNDGVGGGGGDAAKEVKLAAGESEYVIPEHAVFTGVKSLKSKAIKRADGSFLIDDKYVVKGKGTEAEPYLVPWELLASVGDVYKPRLGQTRMPQRVTMFDGAVVKITGFVAFPISATSPKEALVMLNQWDGCCIGTPPTAYDAIEVQLAKAANGSVRLTTSGAITGVLHVDPFEDNGWLLGLYVMDKASLVPGD